MSEAQTASVKDVPSSAASHRYPALDIEIVLELLQLDPGDDLLDPVRVVAFDRLGQLCRPHTRAQEVSLGTEGKGETETHPQSLPLPFSAHDRCR